MGKHVLRFGGSGGTTVLVEQAPKVAGLWERNIARKLGRLLVHDGSVPVLSLTWGELTDRMDREQRIAFVGGNLQPMA